MGENRNYLKEVRFRLEIRQTFSVRTDRHWFMLCGKTAVGLWMFSEPK